MFFAVGGSKIVLMTTQMNPKALDALRDKLQALYDGLAGDERTAFEALFVPVDDEVSGYYMTPSSKAGVVVDNATTGIVVDNGRTGILIDNGRVAFRPIVLPPSRGQISSR